MEYHGWSELNQLDEFSMLDNQNSLPNNCAISAGIDIKLDAKMIGTTLPGHYLIGNTLLPDCTFPVTFAE